MDSEAYLSIIAADYGCDVDDLLEEATFDSIAPGICTSCSTVHEYVEPDARRNACDCCGANRVKSCLVLAGLI